MIAIEAVKALVNKTKEYDGDERFKQVLATILRRSDLFVFLFLSLKFDVFYTVVYLRKGEYQFYVLNTRDWGIFLSSVVVSNLYWWLPAYALACGGVSIWDFLSGQFTSLR